MKKIAGLLLILLALSAAPASFAQDAQTEEKKSQAQRHQMRQETDNKIREMANETNVNRTEAEDEEQESLLDIVIEFFGF